MAKKKKHKTRLADLKVGDKFTLHSVKRTVFGIPGVVITEQDVLELVKTSTHTSIFPLCTLLTSSFYTITDRPDIQLGISPLTRVNKL